MFNDKPYNSIEGTKMFVRDMLSLFASIEKQYTRLLKFASGDIITEDVRDSLLCYNRFASKMNDQSAKLFKMMKSKSDVGDCEVTEITKPNFEAIFTGVAVLPMFDLTNKRVVHSTTTFP